MAWLETRVVVGDLGMKENCFLLYPRKWKTPCMRKTETTMDNSNTGDWLHRYAKAERVKTKDS